MRYRLHLHLSYSKKKEGAARAKDFRSISLLNGIQKIISKVLANRLERVMQELISNTQSAFLKGHLLADAFVTAHEVLAWGFKAGVEGVGVKVDFEKAYDSVSWSFLFKILELLGFNDKWCGWVRECVCNSKMAVLVNGVATNWLKPGKRVRQGDPLSPYLFLLVAECLARLTEKAERSNLLTGIRPTRESSVALIQYADNTLFFL